LGGGGGGGGGGVWVFVVFFGGLWESSLKNNSSKQLQTVGIGVTLRRGFPLENPTKEKRPKIAKRPQKRVPRFGGGDLWLAGEKKSNLSEKREDLQ